MSELKNDMDFDSDEDLMSNNEVEEIYGDKTKHQIRVEKHARLMGYFEDKRLREDLDFIDKW